MVISRQLKLIRASDQELIRQVYVDSIESQGSVFYTQEQIRAWSSLACLPGVLDKPFLMEKVG